MLIPANPALGRTIINGEYLLSSGPLHLSNFSNDPEFPVKTSAVVEHLHQKGIHVYSQKHHETLQHEGIIVGDAASVDDLRAWADKVNKNMLIAGASGFFTALLDKLIIPDEQAKQKPPRVFKPPVLIVSGTAFSESSNSIAKLKQSGAPVSYMPPGIIESDTFDEEKYQSWCSEIVSDITTFGQAIIAIDPLSTGNELNQARTLREKTAIIVKMVFEQIDINELLIEGGSTSSAILKKLGISKIYPVEELAAGVIRMSNDEKPQLYITIKPGSYSWPHSIRQYSLY